MSDIAPPSSGVWYDLDETTTAVLAILRLTEQDVDVDRIRECIPAAAWRIEAMLDDVDEVAANPALQQSLNQVTIELYRRKDAPFDVVRRILDPVRSELVPLKRRWGVA